MYKILIVEDEELERLVYRRQLEKSCLPVEVADEAASGKEALCMLKQTNPQIILMDIKMPGMDGLETARIIREMNYEVEIVFITAYSLFSYSSLAIRLRAADYLLKPVRPQELIAAVQRVIKLIEDKRRPHPGGELSHRYNYKAGSDDHVDNNLIINVLKDYINENYTQKLTLNTLAKIAHYNSSYISSLFKKETGQGITDYITELRLNKARELLLDTSMSIDEIADNIGLNNNSYMTALFKRKVGMNPSDYRRFSKAETAKT